jgi:hypothetical protein
MTINATLREFWWILLCPYFTVKSDVSIYVEFKRKTFQFESLCRGPYSLETANITELRNTLS